MNELRRVVRSGGLASLIDSSWSTFSIDAGDDAITERLVVDTATSATQVWTDWAPEETVAPTGCFSMSALADDLIVRGRLRTVERERFITTIERAASDGRFSMTLTMHAVVAHA